MNQPRNPAGLFRVPDFGPGSRPRLPAPRARGFLVKPKPFPAMGLRKHGARAHQTRARKRVRFSGLESGPPETALSPTVTPHLDTGRGPPWPSGRGPRQALNQNKSTSAPTQEERRRPRPTARQNPYEHRHNLPWAPRDTAWVFQKPQGRPATRQPGRNNRTTRRPSARRGPRSPAAPQAPAMRLGPKGAAPARCDPRTHGSRTDHPYCR